MGGGKASKPSERGIGSPRRRLRDVSARVEEKYKSDARESSLGVAFCVFSGGSASFTHTTNTNKEDNTTCPQDWKFLNGRDRR